MILRVWEESESVRVYMGRRKRKRKLDTSLLDSIGKRKCGVGGWGKIRTHLSEVIRSKDRWPK